MASATFESTAANGDARRGADKESAESEVTSSTPCCRCHCNSLWSVWYSAAVLFTTAYLVYQAGTRFVIYTRMAWPERDRPFWELNAYIALIGTAVVLVPFFFAAGCFRMGNLANDRVTLGSHLSTCSRDTSLVTWTDSWLRRVWVHAGPTAPFAHLVITVFLLAPKLVMEAKLIHLGYLDKDRVLTSNLEVFYSPSPSSFQRLTSPQNSSLFYIPPSDSSDHLLRLQIEEHFSSLPAPNAEFINYTCALVMFAMQYAACFWSGNKCFGMTFSLHNLSIVLVSLCAWDGFSILYKAHVIGEELILQVNEGFLLPFALTGPLCLVSLGLLLATTSILYTYGYHKYQMYLARQRDRYQISLDGDGVPAFGYASHCSALVLLLCSIACNGPLVYDLSMLYRGTRSAPCLVALIALVLHLFVWVLTWLMLSIKHRWTFKLRVTLGNAYLRSAEEIKLVHEVEVKQKRGEESTPMMVVERGRVAMVKDQAVRSRINGLVSTHLQGRRLKWEEEEIYWHKPSLHSPKMSPHSEAGDWTNKQNDVVASSSHDNRGHSRKLSSAQIAMAEQNAMDLMSSDLDDTEEEELCANTKSTVSRIQHHITEGGVVGGRHFSTTLTAADMAVASLGGCSPSTAMQRLEADRSGSDDTSTSGVHSSHSQPHRPGSPEDLILNIPLELAPLGRLCMSLQRGGAGSMSCSAGLPPPPAAMLAAATLPTRLGSQPPRPPVYCADTLAVRQQAEQLAAGARDHRLSSFHGTHPAPQPSDQGVRIEQPVYRNTVGLVGTCG